MMTFRQSTTTGMSKIYDLKKEYARAAMRRSRFPGRQGSVICMFCGKEISVEEALEKQKSKIRKVSQEEYDQYMDTAKAVLEKLIRECVTYAEFQKEPVMRVLSMISAVQQTTV